MYVGFITFTYKSSKTDMTASFENSIFAREEAFQLRASTVTFSYVFTLVFCLFVCPLVALLKVKYAENSHIGLSCRHYKAFCVLTITYRLNLLHFVIPPPAPPPPPIPDSFPIVCSASWRFEATDWGERRIN